MRTALIATLLAGIFTTSAFAADNVDGQKGQRHDRGVTLAQKKAEILDHIEERISNSQAEMACVKAAAGHDELRACREKYRPKQRENQPPVREN